MAASVMIWPIDPVIEPGRDATALWLENRGSEPAVMQVRILGWDQVDGEDRMATQTDVVTSPPIARIPAGGRQLIRIITRRDGRKAGETPYRILIDEVPTPSALSSNDPGGAGDAPRSGSAVVFRMRYSVPLFVYGEGDGRQTDLPQLQCSLSRQDKQAYLHLTNPGAIHARLTDVAFEKNGQRIPVASGLLGYVLPGSTIARPLPAGATGQEPLSMKINGKAEAVTIAHCDGR